MLSFPYTSLLWLHSTQLPQLPFVKINMLLLSLLKLNVAIKIINTFPDFQIVPEIELPGHSTAAVNAMRIRHSRNSNNPDYGKFLTDYILLHTMINFAVEFSYCTMQ